jgi:hypothetical protein
MDDVTNVDDDMTDKNDQDTDEMDKNESDDEDDEDGDGLAYPSSFLNMNIPGGLSSLLPPNMQVKNIIIFIIV